MKSSKFMRGDQVEIIEVGGTLPKELLGKKYYVITKNWNILYLGEMESVSGWTLCITDECVRMWKSKRAQMWERRQQRPAVNQPVFLI